MVRRLITNSHFHRNFLRSCTFEFDECCKRVVLHDYPVFTGVYKILIFHFARCYHVVTENKRVRSFCFFHVDDVMMPVVSS